MVFNTKILLLMSSLMVSVHCGGGGGHHTAQVKVSYPYHTHHEHHVQKIPEVKVVEVPVIKEVKVLAPYKVPYKVKVPYIIKQDIHTIHTQQHPIHSSHHIHHPPVKHHHESHEISKSFSAHASNDVPSYVSHTPVAAGSHDSPKSFVPSHSFDAPHQFNHREIQAASARTYFPSVATTNLNTMIEMKNVGFGSEEGKLMAFEDFGGQASAKVPMAYPYPFSQAQSDLISGKPAVEYAFGFTPSIYDFVSYH